MTLKPEYFIESDSFAPASQGFRRQSRLLSDMVGLGSDIAGDFDRAAPRDQPRKGLPPFSPVNRRRGFGL
jgi:hypothetical protein